MLIAIALVIFIIGISLGVSVYSLYAPFVQQISDIKMANIAYYGALWSIERAYGALRYHEAGFEGTGGRIGNQSTGAASDAQITWFGQLSLGRNGMIRTIHSRVTGQLPASWQGNLDPELQTWDSADYIKLDYTRTYTLPLTLDNTTNPEDTYTWTTLLTPFAGDIIIWTIGLPLAVQNTLNSPLCNNESISHCDSNQDRVADDIIVNRSIKGSSNGNQFTIMPTESINYSVDPAQVRPEWDSTIRESVVSDSSWGNILFGNLTLQPLSKRTNTDITTLNINSSDQSFSWNTFSQILSDPSTFSGLVLQLSLIDLLQTEQQQLFPFLQMKRSFCDGWTCNIQVPDTVYTIVWRGKVGQFERTIIIKKPISESTIGSDFTIIF